MLKLRTRDDLGFQLVVNALLCMVLPAVAVPLWRVVMMSVTPLNYQAGAAFGLPDSPLSSLRGNFPDDQGEPQPIITLSKKHADDGFSGWHITCTSQAVKLPSPPFFHVTSPTPGIRRMSP